MLFFFGSFYFIRFLSQYILQIFHLFCFKGGCLTRRPLWSLRSLSFVTGQLLFYQHCVFASKIKPILILSNSNLPWCKAGQVAHFPSSPRGIAQETFHSRHTVEVTCRLGMGCRSQNIANGRLVPGLLHS